MRAAELRIRPRGSRALRVRVPGAAERSYPGWLEIGTQGERCRLVVHVPFERYVEQVACYEIRGAGPEALEAQAVLVRSYALAHLGRHAAEGFDFCDLTHCQVYPGDGACTAAQLESLRKVAGQVLLFEGELADVAYFSTCGGHTASAADVWGGETARPYLQGVEDSREGRALCARSDHLRWRFEVERDELCAALRAKLPAAAGRCAVSIAETGRGGWVRRVRIAGPGGEASISGADFHLLMGRRFGWSRFKSGHFVVQARGGRYVFLGRGLGHGVGMCQHGAMGLERAGADHRAILEHYFPGTALGSLAR
ncbi:MAG: SpoIID/LytB domain-containing protein [Deltaproteobacteria bacterium]|nr:SpoIID/LytB domain-containing protein [Deltaproteobacteria bacterium]